MNPLIFAAAVALVPGHGALFSSPLDVATDHPGAVAVLDFRDFHGVQQQATCVTPCRLHIPKGAPAQLSFPGYMAKMPPLGWVPAAITRLNTDHIEATLTPVAEPTP